MLAVDEELKCFEPLAGTVRTALCRTLGRESLHRKGEHQIEIYFSIVQRKVLTPNDFADLVEVEARLLDFQDHYERVARPFEWKFTRADLDAVLAKIQGQHPSMAEAA